MIMNRKLAMMWKVVAKAYLEVL